MSNQPNDLINTSEKNFPESVRMSMNYPFFLRVQCLSDLTQLQQHGGSGRLAQIAAAKSTEMLDSPSTGRNKLKRDSFASGKTDDRNRSTEQLLQEKDDEIRKMQQMLQQMQSKLENQHYN